MFQTEKTMKDLGDKLTSSEKEETEALIKELKEALDGKDIDTIKAKKDALQEKAMQLGAKMYENANQQQEETQTNDNNTDNQSDVKDAEYEEK